MATNLTRIILPVFLIALSRSYARTEAVAVKDLRFYAGLSYSGATGVAYQLQYSTNLQNPNGWITVTNVILDTNRLFFVDLDSPQSASRFYRVYEVPPSAKSVAPESTSGASAFVPRANPASGNDPGSQPGPHQPAPVPLSANWGEMIDPDQDCKVRRTNDIITVEVPGAAHDFAAELQRWNAPRILAKVEGDFILQARIAGEFQPGRGSTIGGRRPYNGAGLLVVQDNGNHLSLQRGAVRLGEQIKHYANFELRHGPGTEVSNYEFDIDDKEIFLRVARRGNKMLAMASQDGVNWRAFNPITVDFSPTLSVGVEAINSSKKPFACSFTGLALYREE
jgi:regulation of enolase protein 1 (concanavalin A-like superfamily)